MGSGNGGNSQSSDPTWYTRELNGLNVNVNNIVTGFDGTNGTSSDQFKLPTGNYYVEFGAAFRDTGKTRIRIWNHTANAMAAVSYTYTIATVDEHTDWVHGKQRMVVTTDSIFSLQYRCQHAVTNGLGLASGYSAGGAGEGYAYVHIQKEN